MQWREVIEHPSLKDLPFKIETNEWGKIMMAPAAYLHGKYQSEIVAIFILMGERRRVATECPVKTSKGTKVADVAWASAEFDAKYGRLVELPESPEIIIEIESPSNTAAELEEKRFLYFEKGAREFWLCDDAGNMRFFNPRGELKRSEMFGEFPGRIDVEVA